MEREPHRRLPKQARSQERYEAILATSANLFMENGFEAVTTNEIAKRAGMAVGSLYQYFDNKEAIAEALADRYATELRRLTDELLTADVAGLPLAKAVDALVDPIVTFHTAHPAFSPLWLGAETSRKLKAAMKGMDAEVQSRVESLITARIPSLSKKRVWMLGTVMLMTVKSLLVILGRDYHPAFVRGAARETKRMLVAYINAVIRERRAKERRR